VNSLYFAAVAECPSAGNGHWLDGDQADDRDVAESLCSAYVFSLQCAFPLGEERDMAKSRLMT